MTKPDLKLIEGGLGQMPPPDPHLPETHEQGEMPFAVVDGEPVTQMPKDLYIPPDALTVFLEAFEGPLDVMRGLQLELAGEYLVMAATLAEIKSRMLLPRPAAAGEEEADPRAELVRRLQEYERFKQAALDIEALHRVDRDTFPASAELVDRRVVKLQPNVSLQEMLSALKDVLGRAEMFAHHHISRERLSVRQRMSEVLDAMRSQSFVEFVSLFRAEEGRMGVTVTFIAILELLREGLVEIVQSEPFAPIHVRAGAPRHANVIDYGSDRADAGPQGTEP
jgi:segregation and condensation protein A